MCVFRFTEQKYRSCWLTRVLYLYCRWRTNYQEKGWYLIKGFNLRTFLWLSQVPGFSISIRLDLFLRSCSIC